ncbi:phytoene/squalene synthase family protein [Gordonia soli]|uniref:Phytoene synthase n=1 Tax=Gordonia soli NBRC 108243 TaxID=1223545 RepID=M0QF82_9ACTN|nr:squalene/phytoene synthase family protein [Gordonia soli]GAC66956.1 phytoene synthase [Gordonia soli NBRC 108243]
MVNTSGRLDSLRPYLRYDAVADASAALVINSYSSSFGLATRLLGHSVRVDVHNIYALVRVADEVVDAPRPGHDVAERRRELDLLEEETYRALRTGASANLVVHAFARTARRTLIGEELITPFFASMRMDLDRAQHDADSLAAYIYGSAEVVGLMCLRAFLAAEPAREFRYTELSAGARHLGAAFQKINFLRDVGDDSEGLGRDYLVGRRVDDPAEITWQHWIADIDDDLAAAAAMIPSLPRRSRVAVCAAHDLFAELTDRLRASTPSRARAFRVRVPTPMKLRIVAAAARRRGRPIRRGAEGQR